MDSDQVIEITERLRNAVRDCKELQERAMNDRPFVIVLCGGFSTGKTSLINRLLGCSLPTGIDPVTKAATKLTYGRVEKVFLEHVYTGAIRQISREKAKDFLLGKYLQDMNREYRLRYELPSPLLSNNLVIMDTPGFQDDMKGCLDEITLQEINSADFCIVNTLCNKFGHMEERALLESLQKRMGGNFCTILNCSNYLYTLSQRRDLETRARDILGGFGNEEVGMGRYFVVNSSTKNTDLEGLDTWLVNEIIPIASKIRARTIRNQASELIDRSEREGDATFGRMLAEIGKLLEEVRRTADRQISHLRISNHQRISRFEYVRKNILARYEVTLLKIIKEELSKVKETQWNNKAFEAITNALIRYCKDLHEEMRQMFPEITAVNPIEIYTGVNMRMTKRTVQTVTRGLLDIDRYLYGATYQVKNDYLAETMADQEKTTIPDFRKKLEAYFDSAEQALVRTLASEYLYQETTMIKQRKGLCEELGALLLELHAYRKELIVNAS